MMSRKENFSTKNRIVFKKIQRKIKNSEIFLANKGKFRYTTNCCDMIAVKREVAACRAGFSVERMSRNLTTSHCTNIAERVKSDDIASDRLQKNRCNPT